MTVSFIRPIPAYRIWMVYQDDTMIGAIRYNGSRSIYEGYQVSLGDKIVARGLPTLAVAKTAAFNAIYPTGELLERMAIEAGVSAAHLSSWRQGRLSDSMLRELI